ncbi:hypothetical protein HFO56_23340 [Rhizobium laguerreae]|uniref:hypothetical protein n=1 Tax=Rhizobium laguerreae TaxID=1076926 RepID=UPI001C8FAEEB|nr:hypothetical protein [Rhizobium laguerreae]MBY3155261.1 hypothetical protein [Rhizobium laguerreae]
MTDTFPTKFATKGHFGCQLGDVVDLSAESDTARYLSHSLETVRMGTGALARLREAFGSNGTVSSDEISEELKETLENLREIMRVFPECSHCGQRVSSVADGDVFIPKFECAEAGGLKAYDVLVGIPSGKIAFANDLRNLVVIADDGPSVNGLIGQKVLTQSAASAGLALVFVGNSCPSVVKAGEELHVGCGLPKKGRLGTIVTDLWWYSAMDHDFFIERCAAEGLDPEDFLDFVVDVEPGVYAFSDELADPHEDAVVLSKIRKVDAAAPAISASGVDTATRLEDSQFWKYLSRRRERGGMSRLGDVFCTLGGGLDWIDGGLRSVSGREDDIAYAGGKLEDRKVVRLHKRIPLLPEKEVGIIYPLGWDYPGKLGIAPENIDPYWLAASMMFLATATSQPVKVLGGDRLTEEKRLEQSEENRAILAASLDLLCEIAEVRGLWESGRLEAVFTELVAAFWKD